MAETKDETTSVLSSFRLDSDEGEVYLVLIHGERIGRLIAIAGSLTFGRVGECDVQLDHASVSRRHARVRRRGDRCWIEDLGSTNGTAVNEKPVAGPTPIRNGDRVRIGGVWFRCIAGDRLEQRYQEEIHRLVITDGLTGLANRRHFDEFLAREHARSARRSTPLAIALVDIDLFKRVNDEHGHLAGDAILRALANRLAAVIRQEELLARYGGEELAVVYPDTELEDAVDAAQRLRELVVTEPFRVGEASIPITVSIGVASTHGEGTVEELVAAADRQLYEAKEAGRDSVRPIRAASA